MEGFNSSNIITDEPAFYCMETAVYNDPFIECFVFGYSPIPNAGVNSLGRVVCNLAFMQMPWHLQQAIVAHELGHIYHGHIQELCVSSKRNIDREILADQFAVKLTSKGQVYVYLTTLAIVMTEYGDRELTKVPYTGLTLKHYIAARELNQRAEVIAHG